MFPVIWKGKNAEEETSSVVQITQRKAASAFKFLRKAPEHKTPASSDFQLELMPLGLER